MNRNVNILKMNMNNMNMNERNTSYMYIHEHEQYAREKIVKVTNFYGHHFSSMLIVPFIYLPAVGMPLEISRIGS